MSYHVNSHLNATGDVSFSSGGDTNFKGLVVEGESVTANIEGNFTLESQLDTQNVRIDHSTISGGYGGGTANADYTKQKGRGESQTVSEQTGIHAGSGGFNITVGAIPKAM